MCPLENSADIINKDSDKSSSSISVQEDDEEKLGISGRKPCRRICSLPLDTTTENAAKLDQSMVTIEEVEEQESPKKFRRIRNASLNSTIDISHTEGERRRSRSISLGSDFEKTAIQLSISGSSEAAKKVF